jgi:hypothetical protein
MPNGLRRRSTHPALRAPLSCRFFILGEPQNKTAAPRRGFFGLGFDRDLFCWLFGELEVSGEQEKGEGDADGDEAGEDEVEPDVANTDALAFYDHEHGGSDRNKQQIIREGSGGSIDVGGIDKVHEGIIGLLHEGDVVDPGGGDG